MADCLTKIAANITADCTTIGSGGLEVECLLINRSDIASITYASGNQHIVEAIGMTGVTHGYTYTGFKKNPGAKFSRIISEDLPDKYKHSFTIKVFSFKGADLENIDAMGDLVVIYQSKDRTDTGDGVFRILGLNNGLYPTTDELDENANSGARLITLESLAGQEEPFSMQTLFKTNYATTLALYEALKVAPV